MFEAAEHRLRESCTRTPDFRICVPADDGAVHRRCVFRGIFSSPAKALNYGKRGRNERLFDLSNGTGKGSSMRLKKVVAAATLPAMIASPVAAANPAASLSLRGEASESASAPAAAQAEPGSYAGGSALSTPMIVGGLAIVLIIIGAVALGSGGHHDNTPASA